jgi:hypothetical protein
LPIAFSQIADGGDLETQMFGLTTKFNKMQKSSINNETPAIGNVLLAAGAVNQTKMILEIKNCADCPFSNNDNEYGRDCCNLALQLGKDINLDNWEQLPENTRHKDCPIDTKIELVVMS